MSVLSLVPEADVPPVNESTTSVPVGVPIQETTTTADKINKSEYTLSQLEMYYSLSVTNKYL